MNWHALSAGRIALLNFNLAILPLDARRAAFGKRPHLFHSRHRGVAGECR
jgi:hypothetical protein